MTAAVSALHGIEPISTLNIGGLAAHRSHLASLRHQLAEAWAEPDGHNDAARVQLLSQRKAAAEARIEALRQEAESPRQTVLADAGAPDAASALGANVDEFV
jgi:hypothetical protein